MIITNEALQLAMVNETFIHAKSNGKLKNIKPEKGWTIVLEDAETGLVLREVNSVGDFTIQLSNGEKVKKNICNADISGYLTKTLPKDWD